MALWPLISVRASVLTSWVCGSTDSTAAPNEASARTRSSVLGITFVPKRISVPSALLRISSLETDPSSTTYAETKPVVFAVAPGFPLTIVYRTDSSSEKRTWVMVLAGPAGGVVWPRSMGRSSSKGPRLPLDRCPHETPVDAPVDETQTSLCFFETATLLGNSPGTDMGSPTRERSVGSESEIERMLSELEPAFTAKMCFSKKGC